MTAQRVSVWIKDTDHFFYVRVHATNGSDYYIAYTPTSGASYPSDNYAFIPIGSQYRDGTWRELNRDLSADLQSVFGVGVAYVRWFCIRGDYDLDDLVLFGSEVATRYYHFNGQRVAMRQLVEGQADVVYWLVGDHLGTTSVVLNSDGSLQSEARHYPYGEERWRSGTLPTDYRFTGQREHGYIKLTIMGARWYDPALARWISPDTLIPDPANPQSFNRLAYVYNNPLGFRDPSGHRPFGACEAGEVCHDSPGRGPINERAASTYGVIALVADMSSLLAGGAGALVEILAFTGGAAEPLPVEEAAALALYYETVNPIENTLSAVGTGSVAMGDWFGGYSYRDEATNEWVLGQDTSVSLFALWAGNQSVLPLEGIGDTVVNAPLVVYDLARITGNLDSVIETRIGFNTNRGGLYVDVVVYGALAAQLGVTSGTRFQIALNLGVEIGEVPWEELLYDASDTEE